MLISKFFEQVLGDGSRTNKFEVFFGIDGGQFDKTLSLLLQSTSLPTMTTDVVEYKYKGKSIPIPISCDYTQEWDCNFIVDDHHNVKSFFDSWIERFSIRGENNTFTGKEFSDVVLPTGGIFTQNVVNVKIVQYGFNAEIAPFNSNEQFKEATYMLYNVFPVSVSGIKFDTEDEIQTITVSFKFSHFERID